mmetsp:Transcript_12003/g.28017  ORF Transcript_12003/g.28017 Transcript_12003/m.28017 type:complete len:359 (-) Transcript_12003:148-1224(-)
MLKTLSRSLAKKEKPQTVAAQVANVIRANRLPRIAFELGVVNLVFSAWLFGAYPEHFFLVYLCEFPLLLLLIVVRWSAVKRLLYLAEFCWVTNVLGWLYLALELLPFVGGKHPLPAAIRLGFARALFATANAPLALSVLALSNALVFHDLERWGSLTIHFGPALVSWAIKWKSAKVQEAWPDAFGLGIEQGSACLALRTSTARAACAEDEASQVDSANAPLKLYWCWWVVYGTWLLLVGCRLPERLGWRSSFADMRPICVRLLQPLGVSQTAVRAHAALYLALHAAMVVTALKLLPPVLFASEALHGFFLLGLLLFAVRQGGGYYQHSWGEKLVKNVTQVLAEIADRVDPKKAHGKAA